MNFASIEDLLACATKTVETLTRLFPSEEPERIKAAVIQYILNNSIIQK